METTASALSHLDGTTAAQKFAAREPITKRREGSDGVVVMTPLFDDHLRFFEAVDDLVVE